MPENTETRSAIRRRTLKTARVVLDNGAVFNCVMRNISDTGARIRLEEATPLPQKFRIYLVEDHTIRPCQNCWQRGLECGIAFEGPERMAARAFK